MLGYLYIHLRYASGALDVFNSVLVIIDILGTVAGRKTSVSGIVH
jgi:hypothetical protein